MYVPERLHTGIVGELLAVFVSWASREMLDGHVSKFDT